MEWECPTAEKRHSIRRRCFLLCLTPTYIYIFPRSRQTRDSVLWPCVPPRYSRHTSRCVRPGHRGIHITYSVFGSHAKRKNTPPPPPRLWPVFFFFFLFRFVSMHCTYHTQHMDHLHAGWGYTMRAMQNGDMCCSCICIFGLFRSASAHQIQIQIKVSVISCIYDGIKESGWEGRERGRAATGRRNRKKTYMILHGFKRFDVMSGGEGGFVVQVQIWRSSS